MWFKAAVRGKEANIALVTPPVYDGRPKNVFVHVKSTVMGNLFPDELEGVIEALQQAKNHAEKIQKEYDLKLGKQ
jgi:hypothetical protein